MTKAQNPKFANVKLTLKVCDTKSLAIAAQPTKQKSLDSDQMKGSPRKADKEPKEGQKITPKKD